MESIFKILPFLILIYGGYSTYEDHEAHLESLESLKGQISSKKVQNDRLAKKVKAVEDFIPQIDSVEKKINDFENQIKEIKFKIPPLEIKTDILDELSVEAKKLNIQSISFKPGTNDEDSGKIYFTSGLEFEGVGTYLQFLVFFEKLSIANRVFNVRNVEIADASLKSSGRHKLIRTKAIIETFHYNDNYVEPKPEEEVKKRPRKKR